MPTNDKEYMAKYQREHRQKKTAKTGATSTNGHSDGLVAGRRDQFGDMVLSGPIGLDFGATHYWLRKPSDDFATCTAFEYQGRMIGGCGTIKQYEGKLLDGGTDGLVKAIIDSPYYKEIQAKMPVTRDRR